MYTISSVICQPESVHLSNKKTPKRNALELLFIRKCYFYTVFADLLLFPAVVWPIDVVPEQGGREVVETDEVAGRHVAWEGHIVTVRIGIVPKQDIADGMLV